MGIVVVVAVVYDVSIQLQFRRGYQLPSAGSQMESIKRGTAAPHKAAGAQQQQQQKGQIRQSKDGSLPVT